MTQELKVNGQAPRAGVQRLSLDANDFQKLCRGEVVTQGALQCALQNIGYMKMFYCLDDALNELLRLPAALILEHEDEEVRRWIHGINQGEPAPAGDFLYQFARAVCRADETNYPLLRPALLALKAKFPKYRFSGVL